MFKEIKMSREILITAKQDSFIIHRKVNYNVFTSSLTTKLKNKMYPSQSTQQIKIRLDY